MRFLGSTNPQSNAGLVSGLRIAMEMDTMARTAPQNGHYFLGKGKFRINAGDPLPDGAEFVPAATVAPEPEPKARAKKAAPENKAKPAPENR